MPDKIFMDKNRSVENFRSQGIKIISIKHHSKEPDVFDFENYLNGKKIFESKIRAEQNYGVICGELSDNLAVVDLEKIHPEDYRNKTPNPRHVPCEENFLNMILPNWKDETFTTKTGTDTFHLHLKGFEIPSTTKSFIFEKDHDNIYRIDFKVTGMCVESGSIHPNGKPYVPISNTLKIKRMDLRHVLERLEGIGFKPQGGISGTELENYSYWTIEELQQGNWVRGERRRKQKSFYCKLRRKGKSIIDVKRTITKINDNLSDPLEKKELEDNFKSAEYFFQNEVLPKWGYGDDIDEQEDSAEKKLFLNEDFDKVAEFIQKKYHFVTIRENKEIWCYDELEEIYKPFGHTIIEEECQRLIYKCKKNTVAEVIDTIRRNRTMIHMAELMSSNIINCQDGILDQITFEAKLHSYKYLTISKLPFNVNKKARNLKLWNHILTIIDPKDINLLMELIWIGISGNNPFKRMFVFKGPTNTQKTTLADIISWIIGLENISREKPESFLAKNSRFGTSKFIGKRMNIASEIGNLTSEELENQKSLIGAELQNTERKNDNTERYFDPTKFVFLYTTNNLGSIYSRINDNSVITRYQFLIFRNKIEDSIADGQWYDSFFEDENDRQSAIDTVVNIVIHYKKAQSLGKIPKTRWSTIEETKQILKEQMPIEDKYFEDERIVSKPGSKLSLDEIRRDFESFVEYKVKPQTMGYILKRNGFKSSYSHGMTFLKGHAFATGKNQATLL